MKKCTIKQCNHYDEYRSFSDGQCGHKSNCSNFEDVNRCKQPLVKEPKEIKLTENQQIVFDFLKALSDVELLACDIDKSLTKDDFKIAIHKFRHTITEVEIDDIVRGAELNTQLAIAIMDKTLEGDYE